MLYLIATPIGHLADFSFRAIKTIEECDYLLSEDTRRSRILLNHYQLNKPLVSFHKFNEKARESKVLSDLLEGKIIGLLSDAGTPGIADPGERLVSLARENKISVNAIPGACSLIVALTSSGLSCERFQYVGFLPQKSGRLTKMLEEILLYPGTTVCFETPHRLLKTLKILQELAPENQFVVLRELTKKFESYYKGTPAELMNVWKDANPKGEIVLLFPGN